ncbi:hypothetical protein WN48_07176 [Eufriesea mexicana]|uniref:Uncharacterized protein n=1 Tax=Eufriesea mexicana TaxID=516756 RepID=A0A310SUG6_9HYME|nr:hypothetical protein WN48_07176 [Eufriesea mexicana]
MQLKLPRANEQTKFKLLKKLSYVWHPMYKITPYFDTIGRSVCDHCDIRHILHENVGKPYERCLPGQLEDP